MHIATEPANQPEVLALIEQLDAYQMPLYPAESHHGIDVAVLSQPNVIFAVARDPSG
jgi:putative acetyltransferase